MRIMIDLGPDEKTAGGAATILGPTILRERAASSRYDAGTTYRWHFKNGRVTR
jgi:hypothetical protein